MGKEIIPISVNFIFMNHWGDFHILPSFRLSITYSIPTFIIEWMVFRLDIEIYKHLPNWFMNHVWSWMNFDFLKKKEDD